MPYRYIEEIATADVAFEAWGGTLEELFKAAVDATMNLMVENLDTIAKKEEKEIEAEDSSEDLLLFQVLQEMIFIKDAYLLAMRFDGVEIKRENGVLRFRGRASGEELNREKHHLAVDVKAVTMHRLKVEKKNDRWYATVVLDI
jgi:SHS2 domain-containing protein